MNLPSLLLLLLLLLAAGLALRALWKRRGRGSCSGCAGCWDGNETCPFSGRRERGQPSCCRPDSPDQAKQPPENQEDRL